MATTRRKKVTARRSSARRLPRRSAAPAKATLAARGRSKAGTPEPDAATIGSNDVRRYADLYHFAPVAYARLDPNGVIEEINQAGCRLFRRTVSEVLGRPMIVMITKESRSDFLEHMRRARNVDAVVETDLLLESRDGVHVPVRTYTRRLPGPAGRLMCWTLLIDLTERIRLEEARHDADAHRVRAERDEQLTRLSSEAKDRFLAMLSHELRTPLAPALLAVNRLLAETQDESVGRLGEIIRRNIEIEAHLINDLLDVTRIERGRLEVALEPTDLHGVIVEAVEIVRAQAERKKIRIVADLSAASHHILGDLGRMRQVLWNLLINAVKFSDRGYVEVNTSDDESGGVRVTVKDSGIGMDPGTISKLFRPFERQVPRLGRPTGGLGLGLSICKGIVDAHRGRIWASSAGIGLGSSFEIDLPTIPVEETALGDAAGAPASTANGSRVLLVEDDPDTAAMLEILLRTDGHEVGIVHNLRDALQASDGGWDIVLSDLGLPDGSGLDVARRLRNQPNRPRLIALSGYGTPQDLARSRDAGFDEHLIKPLDFDLLRRMLKSAS